MRFALILGDKTFFFEDMSDMTNALHVADSFKSFEEDCEFNAKAVEGNDSVDLMIKGIKFTDYISFGLDDETRKAYDKFVEDHRTLD